MHSNHAPTHPKRGRRVGALLSVLLMAAGLLWLGRSWDKPPPQPAAGDVIPMTDPRFTFGPGWTLSPTGADPSEPADAWNSPAGVVTFAYTGRELAMNVALGNYWAYLLVTVDGEPANRLPALAGVVDSQGRAAGYRPLLVPEAQTDAGPTPRWLPLHRADDDGPHTVRVEVWRGWSQFPLRGVAVDALPPPPLPVWPGVGLLLAGLWSAVWALSGPMVRIAEATRGRLSGRRLGVAAWGRHADLIGMGALGVGVGLAAGGTVLDLWLVTLAGLGLAGLTALFRPALWLAGVLFGLPFYLYPLPILPGRSLNLIEIGLYGGLVVWAAHWLLVAPTQPQARVRPGPDRQLLILAGLISLALLATFAGPVGFGHLDVAVREWRTVFLAAGIFALLLGWTLAASSRPRADRRLLILAWVAGGTAIGLIGLAGYVNGNWIVEAEGVRRLRSLYGSPNNLALYLERTVMVGGTLALFTRQRLWALLTLPQLLALLLTFSKGGLALGLPAGVLVLGIGGWIYLSRRGLALRPLIWLGVTVLALILGLVPFLGAERFQRIFDVGQGSTGFFRVQLWRSAWQMALDHPMWGVGPDNFLYAYRSGYILPPAWQEPNLNHPHNLFLDLWTRIGLPGLMVAAVWLATGTRRLISQFRSADGEIALIALGMLAAVAAALAHGLIDVSYALPDLMLVWVLMLCGLEPVIGDRTPVLPQILEGVKAVEVFDG